MSRELPQSVIDQFNSGAISIEVLYEGGFSTETIRLWTGIGDLVWNSNTFKGNGYLLGIPGYTETKNQYQGNGVSVVLSGIPAELLAFALNDTSPKNTGKIYLAIFDMSGDILHVEQLFSGTLDQSVVNESPNYSEVVFTYEDEMSKLYVDRELRFTHEEQQSRYPGDRGFEYGPSIASKRIYWGRPDTTRGRNY